MSVNGSTKWAASLLLGEIREDETSASIVTAAFVVTTSIIAVSPDQSPFIWIGTGASPGGFLNKQMLRTFVLHIVKEGPARRGVAEHRGAPRDDLAHNVQIALGFAASPYLKARSVSDERVRQFPESVVRPTLARVHDQPLAQGHEPVARKVEINAATIVFALSGDFFILFLRFLLEWPDAHILGGLL
ncbi:hypothetical protein PG994_009906 [Apiospora phragmitis]|uniref:Uncharacterized protein n=1 Tax=Apiospora phragmitis TaxID=2905665 RepID=A0ABR1TND5_9PEZI